MSVDTLSTARDVNWWHRSSKSRINSTHPMEDHEKKWFLEAQRWTSTDPLARVTPCGTMVWRHAPAIVTQLFATLCQNNPLRLFCPWGTRSLVRGTQSPQQKRAKIGAPSPNIALARLTEIACLRMHSTRGPLPRHAICNNKLLLSTALIDLDNFAHLSWV